MTRMRLLIPLVLFLCPLASPAGEILKVPRKLQGVGLKQFLLETQAIQYGGQHGLYFRKDGTVDSPVADDGGAAFDEQIMFRGRYRVKGEQITIQGKLKKGCSEIDGSCKEERNTKMSWKVQLSGSLMLINGEEILSCIPAGENPLDRKRFCSRETNPVMQLRRAGADNEVWNEVRHQLAQMETLQVVDGPAAKNPREESELWYRGIDEKKARELFFDLVPTVGSVTPISEPAEWKWKTPYQLILIVGRKQTSPPP